MQQDVISLYGKASHTLLEAEEAGFLETLVSRDPWFALPHIILARHHYQSQSTVKDRVLLRAAAYATHRAHLRNYIVGELSTTVTWEESPASEEAEAVTPEVENAAVETPATEPETRSEEPVEETPLSEEPQDQVFEPETSDEQTPVSEVSEEELPTAEENEADVPEPVALTEEAPAKEEAQVEAPERQVAHANPGIHWGLNMRVKLRQEKYGALARRIAAQLAEFRGSLTEAEVTAAPPVVTPEQETPQPEAEVEAPPVEEIKPVEEPPEIKAERISPPESESKEETAEPPVKEKKRRGKPQPESVKKKPPPVRKKKEETLPVEDKDYAIGEFSGLSFLEPAEDEDRGADNPENREQAEEQAPVEPEKEAGIVLEESDRLIEIRISPEQRAKYFKGQAPMELEFSGFNPDDLEIYEPEKELAEIEPLEGKKTSANDDLIDKFIQEEPSISHPNDYEGEDENKSGDSDRGYEDLVTETLAQIHAKQGNTKQAIGIYEKLSLLFPEKRSYFASQIEKLRQ